MTRLIADESLAGKLLQVTHEVEICDVQGKLLGHFLPADDRNLYRNARIPAELTAEEMERRYREGGGKPLAQIWQELGRT
jgi:hypothetical protein